MIHIVIIKVAIPKVPPNVWIVGYAIIQAMIFFFILRLDGWNKRQRRRRGNKTKRVSIDL
jgi:beta-lactamase class D